MLRPNEQKFSTEKCLIKIYKYLSEQTKLIDVERFGFYIDVMHRIFVPPIDRRINSLIEHFIYGENFCENRRNFFCDSSIWIEISTTLHQLLSINGLTRSFLDSIVLNNRLNRIDRELTRMGFETPDVEIDFIDACSEYGNLNYWIERCQSTFFQNTSVSAKQDNAADSSPRQSRKRKACEEVQTETNISSANPSDVSPLRDGENQSKSCCAARRPTIDSSAKEKSWERIEPENDKLKLVVTEVCPGDAEKTEQRIDHLKMPCNSKESKKRVFENKINKDLLVPKKSDKRLENVCVCLNNVTKRINKDVTNNSSLTCNVRDDCTRFKFGCMKSNQCFYNTKIPISEVRRKNLPIKRKSGNLQFDNNDSNETNNCGYKSSNVNEENIETSGSWEDESKCSTRCLWGEDGKSIVSSTCDESIGIEEDKILCSTRIEENGEKSKYAYKNDAMNDNKQNEKTCCPCESKSEIELEKKIFNDVGVMTEAIDKDCCKKRDLILKNVETSTDDLSDTMELTNIYINEISLCYCDNKYETVGEIGVDTECFEKKIEEACLKFNADMGTNTESVQFIENSTQVFFKEIKFCCCDKNIDNDFDIKNIRFDDDRDLDQNFLCNKGTSTDEMLTVLKFENDIPKQYTCESKREFDQLIRRLSSRSKCELTDAMKLKINEIVDLNEKIRGKLVNMKEKKNISSVSVQTLNEQNYCNSMKIQVKTSIISFKSSVSNDICEKKLTPTRIESKRSVKCYKICHDSTCDLKRTQGFCSPVKKSILTEVAASLDNPLLQRLKDDLKNRNVISDNDAISIENSKPTRCWKNFECGDSPDCVEDYLDDKCPDDEPRESLQRNCKCSKKQNFLNYLSDHLTKEMFEKCKKFIRSVLQKILEKGKLLNDLRKSRRKKACRCSYCRNENYYEYSCDSNFARFSNFCSSEKMQTSRLAGGSEFYNVEDRRKPRERVHEFRCSRIKFTGESSACCCVKYREILKNRERCSRQKFRRDDKAFYYNDRLERDKFSSDGVKSSGRLEFNRKKNPLNFAWEKPYDIYEVSSGSLPLSNNWKY